MKARKTLHTNKDEIDFHALLLIPSSSFFSFSDFFCKETQIKEFKEETK